MGYSTSSPADWTSVGSSFSSKPRAAIFSSSSINADLDPKNIAARESVDSPANPKSTPIIVSCDVTGSMGMLAETIVRHGMATIMNEIYERKPVTDPHLMLMAQGDFYCDRAPLQVTQFESDIRLADQLTKFWLEGNGGGNAGESYNAPWYFAANKTKCDSMIKRKKKGYLFTIGDEPPLPKLPKAGIKEFFGDDVERDLTSEELLAAASQNWEVFHLIVNPGHYSQTAWKALLGERAMPVENPDKLAEVIVSTMQVIEGASFKDVVDSWSGDTSVVVHNAIRDLTAGASVGGVTRL